MPLSVHADAFLSKISNPNKVSVVNFYTTWCGYCKSFSQPWKQTARQLSDTPQVQFLQVDCDKYKDVAKMANVSQYPTVMSFMGSRTNRHVLNNTRTEGALKKFILNSVYEKNMLDVKRPVRELTMDDFVDTQSGRWMLLFHLPGCGACTETAPEWEKAAQHAIQNGWPVQFATVDCLRNWDISQSLQLTGYPTIMAVADKSMMGLYYGSKSASDILEYAKSTFSRKKGDLIKD